MGMQPESQMMSSAGQVRRKRNHSAGWSDREAVRGRVRPAGLQAGKGLHEIADCRSGEDKNKGQSLAKNMHFVRTKVALVV